MANGAISNKVIYSLLQKMDDRLRAIEQSTAASLEERKGLRRDVEKLSARVTAWDAGNSIAALALAVWAWMSSK